MAQDARGFRKETVPVAELLSSVSSSFYATYEFNKDWYGKGGHKAEGSGASRQRWGLDLSKVERSRESSKHRPTWGNALLEVQDHVLHHVVSNSIENEAVLRDFFDYEIADQQKMMGTVRARQGSVRR